MAKIGLNHSDNWLTNMDLGPGMGCHAPALERANT